ncbi:MAG: cytochrome c family protein [Planctomycetes bacterium]|nr:cytochrome c family protein [Planctomycetota bacterium]
MKKTCTSIVLGPYFCSAFVAMLIIACIIGGAAMALADPNIEHNSASSFDFAILPQVSQDDVKASLSKISGANACGECHASEFAAWKQSTHFATWSTMHRNAKAKEIAKKMGYTKGIKRNDLCLTCHYTSRWKDEAAKPFAGVSCESCHGPAQDWIDVHKDYGGKEFNIDNETAEHKTTRLEACDKAGMLRSAQVYRIAKNCYTCHTVPNESLVNVGGHPAGSAFELVAWSQGEVRHNYFYSPDQKNRQATADRRRLLFVVGHLTDLEFSLRALAKAEKKGKYLSAMMRRVNNVLKKLDKIQSAHSISQVATALTAVPRREAGDKPQHAGKLKISLSSLTSLIDVADAVSQATKAFANQHDGSDLAAIDSLLPIVADYRGVAQN